MAKVLYHGTTKEFYDEQMQLDGKYHGSSRVYLTDNLWHAIGLARNRAEEYRTSPLLLAIQINKVSKPIKIEGKSLITIESLFSDEVVIFDNLPSLFNDKEADEFEEKLKKVVWDF